MKRVPCNGFCTFGRAPFLHLFCKCFDSWVVPGKFYMLFRELDGLELKLVFTSSIYFEISLVFPVIATFGVPLCAYMPNKPELECFIWMLSQEGDYVSNTFPLG